MLHKVIAFLLVALLPHVAFANSMEKPPEIAPYIKAETPIGQGALTRLWLKGYDASLWTDSQEWSMDKPYALSLRYGMDFTSDEIVEKSIEEIERINKLSKETLAAYGQQLSKLFPDVRKNDVITAMFLPNKGVIFFHNTRKTGEINDLTFARQFLGIWLSPQTSEPKLRSALIGKQGA